MPKAGVGSAYDFIAQLYQKSFNPFMPKAGVGRLHPERLPVLQMRFNPFMPKAGVGSLWALPNPKDSKRVSIHLCPKQALEVFGQFSITTVLVSFQSIYAQSRRWKSIIKSLCPRQSQVSIHLCPKQALEDGLGFLCLQLSVRFNPFMPKAGVGSIHFSNNTLFGFQFQSIYAQSRRWKLHCPLLPLILRLVSIHLCPKQALEVETSISICTFSVCFNPFMPKAGVGSKLKKKFIWIKI